MSANTTNTTTSMSKQALERAQRNFRNKVRDPRVYEEILATISIDDVYKATSDIQASFSGKGKLRHLARIKPFLDRLSEYGSVIETFCQVNDVLAVVWGPIKLILLWSSEIGKVFNKVVDALEKIGSILPEFEIKAQMFETNDVIQAVLVLFYEDILDLYGVLFEFFHKKSWRQLFEVIWPKYQRFIDDITKSLEKHKALMDAKVTFLDIQEAKEARIRSIEEFEKADADRELRKYLDLKSRVSPISYDKRLDWLRSRSVSDCASWLFRDLTFQKWLETSQDGDVWIWIQGIPGAGKTYLTAAAIQHIRDSHLVLFAFASHGNHQKLTALSIVHSLIFQAADGDKDFQAVLLESKERELQGNTLHATLLLQTFLKMAGPVYIIIDGLDEMDECERQILLQSLKDCAKDRENLRLLISSRLEDDISRALKDEGARIRVDKRNAASIQTYVDDRSQTWFDRQQFNADAKSELLQLISPLSAKAEGMFLYARIILDNLEEMNGLEEIRKELKALPTDLKDAYHRIFIRINRMRQPVREKSRKILGWIGCAPVPLTTFEMEQAIQVDLESTEDSTESQPAFTGVNFVQICGPIVEEVDETIQFVHFTVYEYIFSTEVRHFIDLRVAREEFTLALVAYLARTVLDFELDDDEIKHNILVGKYRLFEYAYAWWPILLRQFHRPKAFVKSLDYLLRRGRNWMFNPGTVEPQDPYQNSYLERESPRAFEMVSETVKFYSSYERTDSKWENRDYWIEEDPLTTSRLRVKIHEQHQRLAQNPSKLASLNSHYGSRLIRCPRPFCENSYRGFRTADQQNEHERDHGNFWKCRAPNCAFAGIGFSSKGSRDKHWLKYHIATSSQLDDSQNNFDKLDVIEAQPILFGLIFQDDVEGARRLLDAPGGRMLTKEVLASARKLAATQSSLALTLLLSPTDEVHAPLAIIRSAINGDDVDFARWAISKIKVEDYATVMKAMIGIKSGEIYALWEDHLLEKIKQGKRVQIRSRFKDVSEVVFTRSFFDSLGDSPLKEARVKALFRKIRESQADDESCKSLGPFELSPILLVIAQSSCSLPLTKALVELGADVTFSGSTTAGRTALECLLGNNSREAAHLMQYLVLKGALTMNFTYDLGEFPGTSGISKWLGITWEELCKLSKVSRETTDVIDLI